jgi:hypothetical protein
VKRTAVLLSGLVFSAAMITGYLISCSGDGGGRSSAPQPYPPSYANAKIIFVTSTLDSGDLRHWLLACAKKSTGLDAADCVCQEHASTWGDLSGTYKAWLSDSYTSASARLAHSLQPYVNRRGDQIAANWTELMSGSLQCSDRMSYDESGQPVAVEYNKAWTATDANGNIPAG